MDLVEQVHIFGLSNIHTFEPNISLIKLVLIFNYAKPRLFPNFKNKNSIQLLNRFLLIYFRCSLISECFGFFSNNTQCELVIYDHFDGLVDITERKFMMKCMWSIFNNGLIYIFIKKVHVAMTRTHAH